MICVLFIWNDYSLTICFLFFPLLVPRNHGQNNVLDIDLDIELGNTEEELKDDPGKRRLNLFLLKLRMDGVFDD